MPRVILVLLFGVWLPALAHYAPPLPDAKIAKPARQFGLPFASKPGVDTWLLGQLYGNTPGAYRQRGSTYQAGGGIHFGIDLSARCGTPVVAIGDGVVKEVDGPHGSPPHNLVIDHGNGLASFYGHLLERPRLKVGTRVKRGQVVAKSGDSQFSCTGAPHLHLEIRDASHQRFFNPLLYIAADWDTLALAGGLSRGFQRDLDNPRKWQQPDDQPASRRGGAILANFARPWPPVQGTRQPAPRLGNSFPGLPKAGALLQAARDTAGPRQLTSGGCCVNPIWSPDSSTVLFIDKPTPQGPTAYYGVSASNPSKPKALLPVAYFSPKFDYALLPGSPSQIQRLSDRRNFSLNTGGNNGLWSPNTSQLAWTQTGTSGNFDQRTSEVWVSELEDSPRRVATLYGGGLSGWLDENTLLLNGKRAPKDPLRNLETLNLRSGQRRVLATALGMRGILPSPDGKWIIYYVAFDTPARNGLWLMSRDGKAQRLPWFGSYRWRGNKLAYIALEPGVPSHQIREYSLETGQSRVLADLGSKVSNDQWQLSPDGRRVVFVNAKDRNLWVVDLPQ